MSGGKGGEAGRRRRAAYVCVSEFGGRRIRSSELTIYTYFHVYSVVSGFTSMPSLSVG